MTEFEYIGVKKITVGELVPYTTNDFLESYVDGNAKPLYWHDDVIFTFFAVPNNEYTISKIAEGCRFWSYVGFAKFEKYQEILKNPKSNRENPLSNVSNDKVFVDFVLWLKTRPEWKEIEN